jgi:hypothetical protein
MDFRRKFYLDFIAGVFENASKRLSENAVRTWCEPSDCGGLPRVGGPVARRLPALANARPPESGGKPPQSMSSRHAPAVQHGTSNDLRTHFESRPFIAKLAGGGPGSRRQVDLSGGPQSGAG